jgi:hypothetical protein
VEALVRDGLEPAQNAFHGPPDRRAAT